MTIPHIIAAVPSNRKHWKANQCATIGCSKQNQLLVTSRQNRSTPGIYTEVYLKQDTCYCVTVSGQALGNSRAFVFVYNPLTKERLVPNYTFLPSKTFGCVDAEFKTPHCANEYLCIWMGVLFTAPCNGQQFCLQEIRVAIENHPTHTHLPHHHHHPHQDYPHSHPHPHPHPHHKQCPSPKTVEHCDESVCSDDSSNHVDIRHHHHHFERNEAYHHQHHRASQDPYYTYSSHPCPPKEETTPNSPCGKVEPCHQKANCADSSYSAYTEPIHTYEKPAQPVCIADLQSSLGSMIAQLK